MHFKSFFGLLTLALTFGSTVYSYNNPKAPGEIIWQETFDSSAWKKTLVGGATVIDSLPTGWTFSDHTNNNFYWQWSLVGPRGRHTSPNGGSVPKDQLTPAVPISSTTKANGFLLMPSDWYNTSDDGTSVTPALPMNTTFEYGPVDLSSYSQVHFRMEYFFKFLKPDNASINIVFRDNENHSDTIQIPFQENIPSKNSSVIDFNLTALLTHNNINSQALYFSITQSGPSHYFFMVDDIKLYQPLDRNLRLEETWHDYHQQGGTNPSVDYSKDYFGGYKNIPLSVADTFVQFRTKALNFGGVARNDVYSHTVIENLDVSQVNPIYENSSETKSLLPAALETFVNAQSFRPFLYGRHKVTTTVTDNLPEDSTLNTVSNEINITESLYSYIDTLAVSGFTAMQADTSSANYGYGQLFWVPDIDTNKVKFNTIAYYVHPQQNVNHLTGQDIETQGFLFKKSGVSYEVVQTTDIYKPVAADKGKFVRLQFNNPQELPGNQDYYLVLKVSNQSLSRRLMLAHSPNHKQSFGRSGIIMTTTNSITVVDKTPVFYTTISGGYIPRETKILAYNIEGQSGNTVIDTAAKTVSLKVPYDVSLTSLVPTFVLSVNAVAKINDEVQHSGQTPVDFTNPVAYSVENDTIQTTWTVTVTQTEAPPPVFESFNISGQIGETTIDATGKTISVVMPTATDLTSLIATYTVTVGATVSVMGIEQESGVTANDFTNPVIYRLTPQNGATSDWTVTVTCAEAPPPSFVNYIIAGQIGETVINTEDKTITLAMPTTAELTSLIATYTVTVGATVTVNNVEQESGVTANDFTNPVVYMLSTQNGTTVKWTVTVTQVEVQEVVFESYTIANQLGQTHIDIQNRKIMLIMPQGTNLTSLVATYTLSDEATVSVMGIEQESGVTANGFTNPVIYTVTAQSGISSEWTVRVYLEGELQSGTSILSFGFSGQTQQTVIDTATHKVTVNMPSSANVGALIPLFQLSQGAKAYHLISGKEVAVTSGGNIVDFSNEVTFRIKAEDMISTKDWKISVTTNQNIQAEFETLSVTVKVVQDSITTDSTFYADIYSTNRNMELYLPLGTKVDSIKPVWQVSPGATVRIGDIPQISGVSVVDLTRPVQYIVVAQNTQITKTWTLYTYPVTGIDEHPIYEQVVVYPNPAISDVYVDLPEDMRNGVYSIYNIRGQLVMFEKYRGISFNFNIESLPKGIYFIKVNSDRYQKIEKLIFE